MRARSTHNGVTTTYSLGLLEEVAGGGSTVYTPGVSQRQNGVDRFFHSDWIGSTRYLTDSTGLSAPTAYRFEGYGNVSASAGPDATSRKFAGGHGYESDGPAGLQLLGHRFYDPAVGRFLNPDPIGFAGGLNLYAYCENDPVGMVDPEGFRGEALKGHYLVQYDETDAWRKIKAPFIQAWQSYSAWTEGNRRWQAKHAPWLTTLDLWITRAAETPGAMPIGPLGSVRTLAGSVSAGRMASVPGIARGCMIPSTGMHALDLATPAWRQVSFTSGQGLVYILKDAKTGELLKIGQTTAARALGRFEKYVTAGNKSNRSLTLDVFEVPLEHRGRIEGEIRRQMGKSPGSLPWDNSGRRLGRPGPGTP